MHAVINDNIINNNNVTSNLLQCLLTYKWSMRKNQNESGNFKFIEGASSNQNGALKVSRTNAT